MTPIIASIISVTLIIISYVPYFRGILQGKTRPNAITWLSWAITTAAMGIVQYFSNGGFVVWPIALLVVINIAIFVLAMKRNGRADIVKMDLICFAISMIAFVFWIITRQSAIAMILITASQFVAFVPTIRKTWRKPLEENPFTWSVNSIRYVAMIFAVGEYSVATISNSVWWAFVYGCAAILILTRRSFLARSNNPKTASDDQCQDR